METKKIVKLIKGTVDSNTVLPVLENVKIEDNILTASDLEVTLEIHNINIAGKGLIFFEDFISAIEMIKDYEIEIKDKARIFNETESVELAIDNIGDFPKKPDVSKSKKIHMIDKWDLEKILIAHKFTSRDDLRPAMMGVYVGKDIVATDAHTLYFEKVSESVEGSYLLPPKVVKLMKIMGDEPVGVYANKEFIKLTYSDATIIFRIFEGRFPAYEAVIPTSHSTEIEVDKKEFMDRVTKALKFTNKVKFSVTVTIAEKLFVEGYDLDWDKSYKSDLPIDKTGENVISEFNGKMMLKILNNVKDDKITLKFTGATRAIIIQDNFLLMPIMRNE